MSIPRAILCLLAAAVLGGCDATPSRSEALRALRAAAPSLDSGVAYARVWQDGPPWFSCAEVLAKLASPAAPAVRQQVGNWRGLVAAGWFVVRDSSHGPVTDPGWCVAHLSDEGVKRAEGWTPIMADSFPTGSPRRGWTVPVGRRRLVVSAPPKAVTRDSATVVYAETVVPNASGTAMRVNADSARGTAVLRRVDGEWRVAAMGAGQPR